MTTTRIAAALIASAALFTVPAATAQAQSGCYYDPNSQDGGHCPDSTYGYGHGYGSHAPYRGHYGYNHPADDGYVYVPYGYAAPSYGYSYGYGYGYRHRGRRHHQGHGWDKP